MSKIFYDHLLIFEKVENEIKNKVQSSEEREELWNIVDEIIHQHVLISILDKLPEEHHNDYLEKFYSCPHSSGLITYLNEKIEEDIEKIISQRLTILENEILEAIKSLNNEL